MGQVLLDPPSVEGWHQGLEWIDTGTEMERVNFASERLGDVRKPGVMAMIGRLLAGSGDVVSPADLVQGCLEQMGAVRVSGETRSALVRFAEQGGDLEADAGEDDAEAVTRVAQMLRMVASTPEFQRG